MRFTELWNRGAVYFAAKRQALRFGLTDAEARAYGKFVSDRTQFRFGKLGETPALQTPGGKLFRPFTTFPRKSFEYLVGDNIMPLTRDFNWARGPAAAQRVKILAWTAQAGALGYVGAKIGMPLFEMMFFGMFPQGTTPFLQFVANVLKGATGDEKAIKDVANYIFKMMPGGQRAFTEPRAFLPEGRSALGAVVGAGEAAVDALQGPPPPVPAGPGGGGQLKFERPNMRTPGYSPGVQQLPVTDPQIQRRLEELQRR
jgi:hypothetical protein